MSLLDDLRNLLARHLAHVSSLTNQGTVHLIEDHLARLDAVVSNDVAAAEAKVHEVLGELYAATNAPAAAPVDPPSTPAEPVIVADPAPAEPPVPEPSTDQVPVPVEPLPATPQSDEPAPTEASAT